MTTNGVDARKAIADTLHEVFEIKEFTTYISTKLLAALNRAGWRVVRKDETEL